MLSNQIQERLLFIGIGYDIIGDWLIAESERIYFFNKMSDRLHLISKNIYEFFKNLPGWGRSFSDLLHFWDWFQIKMNFNRNVSCLIAVYFFMDNDFFNQLV